MAYYDALVEKWATLEGTAHDKLVAVNAATEAAADRLVPIAEVMTYLRSNALWLPIKAAAGSNPAAAACVDLAEDLRAQEIDFSLTIAQQVLGGLVQSGLLSADQADHLQAMKNVFVPWWQAHNYPGLFNESDLIAAGLS